MRQVPYPEALSRAELGGPHPKNAELLRFLRLELPRADVQAIVRHLLAGCPTCSEVIRPILGSGSRSLRPLETPPQRAGLRQMGGLPR